MPGYLRRTFHVERYLRELRAAAAASGFQHIESRRTDGHPISLLQRYCPNPLATLYLSAGMHGDEPAGPLALIRLLKRGLLPATLSYVIFPLLNPAGMARNQRNNREGLDINRDYARFQTAEARAHRQLLENLPRHFDLCVNLHEDWEASGYYIYEINPDRETSLAPLVLSAVDPIIGVDRSPFIDGFPSDHGVIRPRELSEIPLAGDDYPETLYLLDRHTRHSYTFETPSNVDLHLRVAAHTAAVQAAIRALHECGHWFDI